MSMSGAKPGRPQWEQCCRYPWMLNILPYTTPTTKNYPAQNAISAKGKTPWPKETKIQKAECKLRFSLRSQLKSFSSLWSYLTTLVLFEILFRLPASFSL